MSDLRLKCTKFDFGWGSALDPAGGTYSAPPDPLARFKGTYFLLLRAGMGLEGKVGDEKRGDGRGTDFPPFEILNTPLFAAGGRCLRVGVYTSFVFSPNSITNYNDVNGTKFLRPSFVKLGL